jgi:cytochrome P450
MVTQQIETTLPPGPRGLPVFSDALAFRNYPLQFLRRLERVYGRMATIHLGHHPFVLLFRPEQVRYVLMEHPRNFTSREVNARLSGLLGNGLLNMDGEEHRQHRRIIQPAFHKRRVESYARIMIEYTHDQLDRWQPGSVTNIAQDMRRLTLRIVTQALFDVDLNSEGPDVSQAFTDIIDTLASPLEVLGRWLPFLPSDADRRIAARNRLDTFVYNLITQRRAEGRDRGDVLSMLLCTTEGEEPMADQQVRDHIMTLMAAGHETTTHTLSWTFYLLSRYPIVYKKLLSELHNMLSGRDPTLDDLPNLPYLDWVVNESWRMYPPAWLQGRRAIEAFDLDSYHLPAGIIVLFSQWVLHYLPDIWGDPNVFRPERWNPEHAQKLPQGAYFPFGGGPRICIGMPFAQLEARLLLATILQRYTPHRVPGHPVVLSPQVTLRPKYGMIVKLFQSSPGSP